MDTSPASSQLVTQFVYLKMASSVTGYATSTIRRWVGEGRVDALKGPDRNSPVKVSLVSLELLLAVGQGENTADTPLNKLPPFAFLETVIASLDRRCSAGEFRNLLKGGVDGRELRSAVKDLQQWLVDVSDELD